MERLNTKAAVLAVEDSGDAHMAAQLWFLQYLGGSCLEAVNACLQASLAACQARALPEASLYLAGTCQFCLPALCPGICPW